MRSDLTLYCPGDGVTKNSHTATYKGIKDFKINNNGTVTFKTTKYGTITTPLLWRLKEGLADDAPLHEEANEAPEGNRARVRGY